MFGVVENKTVTEEDLMLCGANFCPSMAKDISNLERPAVEKVCFGSLTFASLLVGT